MEYQSVFNSPKKYYRWFRDNKWHGPEFSPLVTITEEYNIIPRFIDGNLCWFNKHFKLKTLEAFSFGGRTTISYNVIARSKSLFSFRPLLKEEGVVRNLYQEKQEVKEKMNNPNFKKIIDMLRRPYE